MKDRVFVNCLESHSARLADAVRESMDAHGYTLSALESCTGGLIGSILTDVPGAGYFKGGAVAYDPEIKRAFGVSPETMSRNGLVSPEVALELAACAARWFGTDVGLGITGVTGPGPEDGVPAGTAYAAVWSPGRGGTVLPIEVGGDRKSAKVEMACLALGLLLEELEQSGAPHLSPQAEAWIGR